jgi:hypothetical protein
MRQCLFSKLYEDPYFLFSLMPSPLCPSLPFFTWLNTSAPLNATLRPYNGGYNDRMRVAAKLGSGVTKMLIFADLLPLNGEQRQYNQDAASKGIISRRIMQHVAMHHL